MTGFSSKSRFETSKNNNKEKMELLHNITAERRRAGWNARLQTKSSFVQGQEKEISSARQNKSSIV